MFKTKFFIKLFSKIISHDVFGIDLGSDNTIIFSENNKKFFCEKTIFYKKKGFHNEINVNNLFKKDIIKPVKNSFIVDNEAIEKMMYFILSKISKKNKPAVILTVIPFSASKKEQSNTRDTMELCYNVKKVLFVYKNIAAAIGAGLAIDQLSAYFIIDIGSESTEMSLIFANKIIENKFSKFGGKDIDRSISKYFEYKYNLLIEDNISEKIKNEIGSFYFLKSKDEIKTMTVYGRNTDSKKLEKITINQNDIVYAFSEFANLLIEDINDILERAPAEILKDILEKGVTICGGCSQIANLDFIIKKTIGINVNFVNEPQFCVARGLQKIIENYDEYKHFCF